MSRHLLLASLVLACGPGAPGQPTSSSSSSTDTAATGASDPTTHAGTLEPPTTEPLDPSTTEPPDTATSAPPNPATGDASSTGDDPATTAGGTTGSPPGAPCDLLRPDCPEGQKCNVFTDVGDNLFQGGFKCVPLVPDPKPPHAACDVFGDPLDGTDDCEAGSVCLYPDDQGIGECFAFCTLSGECSVPGDTCVGPFCQSCLWTYCDEPCDILDPDACTPGDVCVDDGFVVWSCMMDASGDAGQHGDPCDFVNACDPGHLCVPPSALPDCQSDSGCCAIACDTTAPDTCPDQGQGVACEPYYGMGQAPTPELADVGLCIL